MTADDPGQAALEVSVREMTAAVHGLAGQLAELAADKDENRRHLAELKTYGKKNRSFIRFLAFTVCFDLAMSGTIGLIGWKAFNAANSARHATSLAERNHQSAVTQCLAGNDFRRLDRERWQQIIDFSTGGRPQTPEQQAQTAKFLEIIDKADAPRDCSQVGK